MEKMSLSITRRLEIMSAYNMSSNCFDLIQMIFMAQEEEGHPEFLYNWFKIHGTDVFRETLQELKDKGVILKSYKIPQPGDDFTPDDIEFNNNFMKAYYKHSGDLGAELFKAYPSFVNINGKACSLKNITKYYSSLDDFFFSYGKAIKFNPKKHEEVLELLEQAKNAGLIHYGILEFVGSQKWLTLEEEMREGGIMNTNIEVEFV